MQRVPHPTEWPIGPRWNLNLNPVPAPRRPDVREVAPAHTWLLRVGWKRYGLVDPSEVPGSA